MKSMKDIINVSYNLRNFIFLPGLMDVTELGETAISNDLADILMDLPDEVFPLLSPEKVGEYMKNKMGGTFTSKGYCYRVSEQWNEIYDGITIPEQLDGEHYMFSLCLCPQWKNAEATWLKLPYSIQEKEQVLAILGIDSLKECVITQIRSAVPTFEYTMSEDTDIEKLNQLARQLDTLPVDELIKYKAILESDAFGGLERAIQLLNNMDMFEFEPNQRSYASYGRACLEQLGVDLDAEAFRNFDFERYGEKQLIKNGMVLTSYGVIKCDPLYKEDPEYNLLMGLDLEM